MKNNMEKSPYQTYGYNVIVKKPKESTSGKVVVTKGGDLRTGGKK